MTQKGGWEADSTEERKNKKVSACYVTQDLNGCASFQSAVLKGGVATSWCSVAPLEHSAVPSSKTCCSVLKKKCQ